MMEESGVSILVVDINFLIICYRLENRESEKERYACFFSARKTSNTCRLL